MILFHTIKSNMIIVSFINLKFNSQSTLRHKNPRHKRMTGVSFMVRLVSLRSIAAQTGFEPQGAEQDSTYGDQRKGRVQYFGNQHNRYLLMVLYS